MSQTNKRSTIQLSELHLRLIQDWYYGQSPTYVDAIIAGIYKGREHDHRFMELGKRYSVLPCKDDQHRLLIYLWMELNLPAYWNGQKFSGFNRKNGVSEFWKRDFTFFLPELKQFLRLNQFPLPTYFFPDEPDNTANKLQKTETEYDRSVYNLTVLLPRLEVELEETINIYPESMAESREKKRIIDKIENDIASIRNGCAAGHKVSPAERKQKLHAGYDEEVRLRGELGALQRTANREGISRQYLREILDRET